MKAATTPTGNPGNDQEFVFSEISQQSYNHPSSPLSHNSVYASHGTQTSAQHWDKPRYFGDVYIFTLLAVFESTWLEFNEWVKTENKYVLSSMEWSFSYHCWARSGWKTKRQCSRKIQWPFLQWILKWEFVFINKMPTGTVMYPLRFPVKVGNSFQCDSQQWSTGIMKTE